MKELILDDFKKEVQKSKKPVLLYFSAYWCSSCYLSNDDVNLFEIEHEKELKVLKIDVDKQEELALRFEVKNLPCFVLIFKGKQIVRLEGMQTKQQLEEAFLNKISKNKNK